MPDWRQLVRQRLGPLGLKAQREEEIRAELAGHLEDAYQDALRRGLSPETAMASAHEQVPDWQGLARKIRRAGREEDAMSRATKTLWLPGMSALFFSAVLLLVMTRLIPPVLWNEPSTRVRLLVPWLLSYIAIGAAGAYWSRREGGSKTDRFVSGVFPVAMHLAIFVLPIIVALVSNDTRFPEHLLPSWLLKTAIVWVLIPGVALAIGTLPFLRDGSTKSSMATAQATGQ